MERLNKVTFDIWDNANKTKVDYMDSTSIKSINERNISCENRILLLLSKIDLCDRETYKFLSEIDDMLIDFVFKKEE